MRHNNDRKVSIEFIPSSAVKSWEDAKNSKDTFLSLLYLLIIQRFSNTCNVGRQVLRLLNYDSLASQCGLIYLLNCLVCWTSKWYRGQGLCRHDSKFLSSFHYLSILPPRGRPECNFEGWNGKFAQYRYWRLTRDSDRMKNRNRTHSNFIRRYNKRYRSDLSCN